MRALMIAVMSMFAFVFPAKASAHHIPWQSATELIQRDAESKCGNSIAFFYCDVVYYPQIFVCTPHAWCGRTLIIEKGIPGLARYCTVTTTLTHSTVTYSSKAC